MGSVKLQSHISRRALIKRGTAAGIVAATSLPRSRPAFAAEMESELVFACDGGIAQKMFEREVIPEFSRRHGTKVTYVPGQPADNLAKLRAQKNAPTMDVV